MTPHQENPLRILVMHAALLHRVFEASEVWQSATAMLISAEPGEISLSVTDCRQVWEAHVIDGRMQLGKATSMLVGWRGGADVVHVHLAIPLRHLLWAALFRLRGTPVVFSPMALLTRDFARASWYRRRHALFRMLKPLLVRALAVVWCSLANWVMCLSELERRQTRIPLRKALFAPWPLPDTPLAAAALSAGGWPHCRAGRSDGPVAVVTRFDPWRKGFDRLCAWLESHRDEVPRPAAVLFAPAVEMVPAEVRSVVERDLLEWEPETKGSDLLPRVRQCRAAMLLSRWDAQPRALREAVVMGLPTVSTPSTHFEEVVEVLGVGAVVDGDDTNAVHRAFMAVAAAEPIPGAAKALFGPLEQGRWLVDVLRDVAARVTPPEPSYYRVAARSVAPRPN